MDLPSWTGFSDACHSIEEIHKAMASMKDGAPGKDGTRIRHLRSDPTLRASVVLLIQQIWSSEEIPSEWREAILVPIPKKGKAHEPKDFHPIMLLSVPSKILTKLIHLEPETSPSKMVMQQAKKCGVPPTLPKRGTPLWWRTRTTSSCSGPRWLKPQHGHSR